MPIESRSINRRKEMAVPFPIPTSVLIGGILLAVVALFFTYRSWQDAGTLNKPSATEVVPVPTK